ncbi:unnamed protein product [Closterium sp. NIES-64]|nr:unnamed protein product [Closterium sp. NIES-64]
MLVSLHLLSALSCTASFPSSPSSTSLSSTSAAGPLLSCSPLLSYSSSSFLSFTINSLCLSHLSPLMPQPMPLPMLLQCLLTPCFSCHPSSPSTPHATSPFSPPHLIFTLVKSSSPLPYPPLPLPLPTSPSTLGNTAISGELPRFLTALTRLANLDVTNTELRGTVPPTYGALNIDYLCDFLLFFVHSRASLSFSFIP